MKIVLVITDTKRKSLVFISNELDTYSLEKAVQLTHKGKIERVHTVQRDKYIYLRTNPKVPKNDEFDTISITIGNLLLYTQSTHLTGISPALKLFIELYRANLGKDRQLIKPVGQPEVLLVIVRGKLQQHQKIIFDSAKKFDIDPYLVGAILIDEITRMLPFEKVIDIFGTQIIGRNTSLGIAQVKIDTANNIIKLGLYNPNPKDPKLPFRQLNRTTRTYLYTYLIQPKHNIFFAAAIIKDIINSWHPIAGNKLTLAVIATIYSQGGKPHPNPAPNERGEQIADEFYNLAKKILK